MAGTISEIAMIPEPIRMYSLAWIGLVAEPGNVKWNVKGWVFLCL
jgi:hypothetical protein